MTQQRRWRITDGFVAVAILAVIVLAGVIGQVVASARADGESPGIPTADRDQVRIAAHDFWDNPGQRLAFRAYGVRGIGPAPADCDAGDWLDRQTWEVTAYTLFGIPLDSVRLSCDGIGYGDP